MSRHRPQPRFARRSARAMPNHGTGDSLCESQKVKKYTDSTPCVRTFKEHQNGQDREVARKGG
jgi:hypothetical protein